MANKDFSGTTFNEQSVRTDLTVTCSSVSDNSVDAGDNSLALLGLSNVVSPQQRLAYLENQTKLLETHLSRKCLLLKIMGDNLKAAESRHAQELSSLNAEKAAIELKHKSDIEAERQYLHKFQEQMKNEMSVILKKQKNLEATNERLQMEETRRKECLDNLILQERDFEESLNTSELPLPEYAALKVREIRKLYEEGDKGNKELQFTLDKLRAENMRLQSDFLAMKTTKEEIQQKFKEAVEELSTAKSGLTSNLFTYDNFVALQKERNDLRTVLDEVQRRLKNSQVHLLEVTELRKLNTEAQRGQEALMKELSAVQSELDNARLENQELRTEKRKIAREYYNLKKRFAEVTNEAQEKLKAELERLKETTRVQLRECSSADKNVVAQLEMARDRAVQERNTLEKKCYTYQQQLYSVENALRVKEFEVDKSELLRQELTRKVSALETTKLNLQHSLEKSNMDNHEENLRLVNQNRTLSKNIQELQVRLEEQKTIARELEEAFVQVTAIAEDSDVLNISPMLQRQFKQSQETGRRLTELESVNRILNQTLQNAQKKLAHLEEDLHSKDKILHGLSTSAAPQTLSLIHEKDAQIRQLRSLLEAKECQLLDSIRELEKLRQTNQRLTEDLEQILQNRQEIEKLKKQLEQDWAQQ